MKKFFKAIFNWFKDSKFTDWLLDVFKDQLGKIVSIIYKDAVEAVNKTKILSEFVISQTTGLIDIQRFVISQFGVHLSFGQINDIIEGKNRVRFYIAKELLEAELKKSGKEYKSYIIDTVIQLAYSYIKEKGEK